MIFVGLGTLPSLIYISHLFHASLAASICGEMDLQSLVQKTHSELISAAHMSKFKTLFFQTGEPALVPRGRDDHRHGHPGPVPAHRHLPGLRRDHRLREGVRGRAHHELGVVRARLPLTRRHHHLRAPQPAADAAHKERHIRPGEPALPTEVLQLVLL